MIRKLISGGQTGADRAALDVAIKMGIAHGGWIPKGRKTEEGRLPASYGLSETETGDYRERTEKNVLEADGTLIVSHGPLTGGSAFTRHMARHHQRPWLHIDLSRVGGFQAARQVGEWIHDHHIEVLNVAGPRASRDPEIYRRVSQLLESVCYIDMTLDPGGRPGGFTTTPGRGIGTLPATVDEAVDHLVAALHLKDRIAIANMEGNDIDRLKQSMSPYMQRVLGLGIDNEALLQSCAVAAGVRSMHVDSAESLIVERLWKQLAETHRLRAVK